MPFTRPTLEELVTRVTADVSSKILSAGLILERSVIGIMVRVFAGVVHGLYDYISYGINQAIPDTAEDEFLDRHVNIYLPGGRLAASPAQGTIRFTGTDGAVIPIGTQINRSDGISYTTDAAGTIGSVSTGLVDIAVTAESTGSDTNTAENVILTLTNFITNVDDGATVQSPGLLGGADTETDESVRQRMLDAIEFTPQGGSIADYEVWARQVPDVEQVFVFANAQAFGLGTVKVQFSTFSGTEIPGAPKVAEVQAEIDAERPVTATTIVSAPLPFTANIDMAITPDTPSNQTAVTAEIQDFIKRTRVPGEIVTLDSIAVAALSAGVNTAVVLSPVVNIDPGADGLINVVNVAYP